MGAVYPAIGRWVAAKKAKKIGAGTRMGALPYLARAQTEYAGALLARGRPDDRAHAARLLAEARAIATSLGQRMLREELAALAIGARFPSASSPVPSPTAPAAALRKEGDFWTVEFGGESFRLKDSKGLLFVSVLLRHPGRELHVLDLVRGGVAAADERGGTATGLDISEPGDAGELLDPTARSAYKRRLKDLRDELQEAEHFNDPGRAERARREIDFLSAELSRAVGLGGRVRRAANAAERARQNTCRTIGAALKKIGEGSPALGQYLAATVRTGMFCCYEPSFGSPLAWRL